MLADAALPLSPATRLEPTLPFAALSSDIGGEHLNGGRVEDNGAVDSPSLPLFDDPRVGLPDVRQRLAFLDLWRIHLDQCPECGHTHAGGGACGGRGGRPERHIYHDTERVPDDLICALCGEAFQDPVVALCGHHYCNSCVRALLMRTAGRAACPIDGQVLTRFATQPPDPELAARLSDLRIRCPVCKQPTKRADIALHLQDPVHMIEEAGAYEQILRPFYMSCPLSSFTVGEFNGTSSVIRFYRGLGAETLRRFVRTSDYFIVLPDPKMGFQPHTEQEVEEISQQGGYFCAWWVHPAFRPEVWWAASGADRGESGGGESAFLLRGQDCSQEPWTYSSFCHTWSTVQKPRGPSRMRYLCSLRDLRGEHVDMLEAFRSDVLEFLGSSFGASRDSVCIYCHYPNSSRYSTLHFHIIFGPRFQKYAQKLDRPHQLSRQFSLDGILENLRRNPLHFAEIELSYFLGEKADLMDPISMFYSCSPHRHLQAFTFKRDEQVVPAHRRQRHCGAGGASALGDNSGGQGSGADGAGGGGAAVSAADFANVDENAGRFTATDRLNVQVAALRHGLEDLQRVASDLGLQVAQLTSRVGRLARDAECQEEGACRVALQALAAERRASWGPAAWTLLGAAIALFVMGPRLVRTEKAASA